MKKKKKKKVLEKPKELTRKGWKLHKEGIL
jgi:hypothetical protein